MSRKKKPGTVILIELDHGFHCYGRELKHPFVAFYDCRTNENLTLESIINLKSIFILAVLDKAFTKWKKIGFMPLEKDELKIPNRFTQDMANFHVCSIIDENFNERDAKPEECEGLERVVVWAKEHVESRLKDHFNGKENVWANMNRVEYPDR